MFQTDWLKRLGFKKGRQTYWYPAIIRDEVEVIRAENLTDEDIEAIKAAEPDYCGGDVVGNIPTCLR